MRHMGNARTVLCKCPWDGVRQKCGSDIPNPASAGTPSLPVPLAAAGKWCALRLGAAPLQLVTEHCGLLPAAPVAEIMTAREHRRPLPLRAVRLLQLKLYDEA